MIKLIKHAPICAILSFYAVAAKQLGVSVKDLDGDGNLRITGEMVQQAAERIVDNFVDLTVPNLTEKSSMRYISFYGFLRPSEYCVSSAGHEVKLKDTTLNKSLKTFKHSKSPEKIRIGKQRGKTCPVHCLHKYLKHVNKIKPDQPFFPLDYKSFLSEFSQMVQVLDLPSNLTPHMVQGAE